MDLDIFFSFLFFFSNYSKLFGFVIIFLPLEYELIYHANLFNENNYNNYDYYINYNTKQTY